MKSFLSDGLSIDETRISILVICLLACIFSACYLVVIGQQIPETLKKLTQWLIGGITTVNVSKQLTSKGKESDIKCQQEKPLDQ